MYTSQLAISNEYMESEINKIGTSRTKQHQYNINTTSILPFNTYMTEIYSVEIDLKSVGLELNGNVIADWRDKS